MSEKQPIDIELPKETIEALLNGASKFIVPIKSQGLTKLEVNEYHELTCSNCGHIADNTPKHICLHCEGLMCYENAPLQIGDEFYVQEEFIMGYADVEEQLDYRVFYKNETPDLEWCDAPEDEPYPAPFNEASQMTPEQSRIKGKITDVRVKNTNSLSISDKSDCYQPFTGNKKLCWPD